MTIRSAALAVMLAAGLGTAFADQGHAQPLTPHQTLTRDIFRELVEIDTTQSKGDTFKASEAMAARLRAAGFTAADVQTFETAPKRGNMVARLRGTGTARPILLLAHIDVVEAAREDWSTDPFKLIEKGGFFYGRGTMDDKYMAAALVANFIRYRQERFRPARDIILALTTDEEIADENGYGINWLLKNRRDLIDAEFALNEGGHVGTQNEKVLWNSIQTSEKLYQDFWLEVRNKGGHSSLPEKDNAIYRLSAGLSRLAGYDFPVRLNETTRRYFEVSAGLEQGQTAADMRAILASTPDAAASARLAAVPAHNARLRTTCVATRLEGGHADNALPQRARAMVNCRIIPGDTVEGVTQTLKTVLADDQIVLTEDKRDVPSDPSPLTRNLLSVIEPLSQEYWPGSPILPIMSTGATDGRFLRNAGIPTYGHTGLVNDVADVRAHGRDERIGVEAFYQGQAYLYDLVKALSASK